MKADLTGQIRELMDQGMHPVTMTDVKSHAPVRIMVARRATARARLAASRLVVPPASSPAPRSGRAVSPGGRSRRPRRAIMAATVAAGLAIAATAVGVASLGSPARPAFDAAAVRLLAKVASAAARQPVPHVRDSQFMYIETRAAVASTALIPLGSRPRPLPRHLHLKLITERVWVPVANACGPAFRRSKPANGKTAIETYSGENCRYLGWLNDPTYRLLQALPASPRALLALIYRAERGHGPGPDQEAFVTIGDLLRNTIAPPRTAAALYRAAALIPGVTLIPGATDAIGRPGIAVGRVGPGADGGVREELIFSRSTLRLLGERTVIARTGVTTSATAIVARAFVGHRGQIP
jgi:hypothetical protein